MAPVPGLTVVMPMAGLGSRFVKSGFKIPKPLLPVLDRPMYAWATDSLPLADCARLIFILLAGQPGFSDLCADIRKRYAVLKPEILTVPALTSGQAETVLRARNEIDPRAPLLIHNADTAFETDSNWARRAYREGLDGALLVFESEQERWSYSREDDQGRVVEIREKMVISPWATTGTYWFRRGDDFVEAADSKIRANDREKGEFYVGPLYNDLIARGARVRNFRVHDLQCFGTPEDLRSTLGRLEGGPSPHIF